MPFGNYEVFRGQSRGLDNGLFSFLKKPKTDESGMETNKKVVGTFKGRISCNNDEEKREFDHIKIARKKIISTLIENIHEKKFGSPMNFPMKKLTTFEGR